MKIAPAKTDVVASSQQMNNGLSGFEFENWAVKQFNGRANKVQIGDLGIDGRIYPAGVQPREAGAGELALVKVFSWGEN
jgi:hypothetical protein